MSLGGDRKVRCDSCHADRRQACRAARALDEKDGRDVARLEERNSKALSEFPNGAKLREWEIENLNDDFKLSWGEQAKLHALDSELGSYNVAFLQAAQGQEFDQPKLMAEMADSLS